jgi:hypothetical protein
MNARYMQCDSMVFKVSVHRGKVDAEGAVQAVVGLVFTAAERTGRQACP